MRERIEEECKIFKCEKVLELGYGVGKVRFRVLDHNFKGETVYGWCFATSKF